MDGSGLIKTVWRGGTVVLTVATLAGGLVAVLPPPSAIADSSAAGTITTVTTTEPTAMAIGGANDDTLYATGLAPAVNGVPQVSMWDLSTNPPTGPTTESCTHCTPYGQSLAADEAGNLYWVAGASGIWERNASTGAETNLFSSPNCSASSPYCPTNYGFYWNAGGNAYMSVLPDGSAAFVADNYDVYEITGLNTATPTLVYLMGDDSNLGTPAATSSYSQASRLSSVAGIVATSTDVFVPDQGNKEVVDISLVDPTVDASGYQHNSEKVIAGNGDFNTSDDDQPALYPLAYLQGIALDGDGQVYFGQNLLKVNGSDVGPAVFRINAGGNPSADCPYDSNVAPACSVGVVAGGGSSTADNVQAASETLNEGYGGANMLAVGGDGALYVDNGAGIKRVEDIEGAPVDGVFPSAPGNVAVLASGPGNDYPNSTGAIPDQSVYVSWAPPSGSYTPTDYTVVLQPPSGNAIDDPVPATGNCTGGTCSTTVGGLTDGSAYSVAVQYQDGTVWSSPGLAGSPVTPESPVTLTVTGLSPSSGSDAGGYEVDIQGTGFTANSNSVLEVVWGHDSSGNELVIGQACGAGGLAQGCFIVASDNEIRLLAPPDSAGVPASTCNSEPCSGATPGTAFPILVVTSNGGAGSNPATGDTPAVGGGGFSYAQAVQTGNGLTVTGLSPSSGSVVGNYQMAIQGSGFTANSNTVTGVVWGNSSEECNASAVCNQNGELILTPCSEGTTVPTAGCFVVASDSEIDLLVPPDVDPPAVPAASACVGVECSAATPGTPFTVLVETTGGVAGSGPSSDPPGGFTYNAPSAGPSIALSPSSGGSQGEYEVDVQGSGFGTPSAQNPGGNVQEVIWGSLNGVPNVLGQCDPGAEITVSCYTVVDDGDIQVAVPPMSETSESEGSSFSVYVLADNQLSSTQFTYTTGTPANVSVDFLCVAGGGATTGHITSEPGSGTAPPCGGLWVLATVTDASGQPVAGETVSFNVTSQISDGLTASVGDVIDQGNGHYIAPFTPPLVTGNGTDQETFTATVAGNPSASGQGTINFTPTQPDPNSLTDIGGATVGSGELDRTVIMSGGTVQFTVPQGALPQGTQISLHEGNPSQLKGVLANGESPVGMFGVSWISPPNACHPAADPCQPSASLPIIVTLTPFVTGASLRPELFWGAFASRSYTGGGLSGSIRGNSFQPQDVGGFLSWFGQAIYSVAGKVWNAVSSAGAAIGDAASSAWADFVKSRTQMSPPNVKMVPNGRTINWDPLLGTASYTDSAGHVIAVGSGSIIAVGSGSVIAVGSGSVIAVGSGSIIAVGSGSLTTLDQSSRASGVLVPNASGQVIAVGSGSIIAVGSGALASQAWSGNGIIAVGSGAFTPDSGLAGAALTNLSGGFAGLMSHEGLSGFSSSSGSNVIAVGSGSIIAVGSGSITAAVSIDPGFVIGPGLPGPPGDVGAIASGTGASVSWHPAVDGGSPVTSYQVTAHPDAVAGTSDDVTLTVDPPAGSSSFDPNSTATISTNMSGLTPGTLYDVSVTATNAMGTGPASPPAFLETQSEDTGPAPGGTPSPPAPPSPPPDSTGSSNCSSWGLGGCTATDGDVTVNAIGPGALTLSEYGSDPAGPPLQSFTGRYFDVQAASSSAFLTLSMAVSHVGGHDTLYWWNGSTWQQVTGDPGPTFSAGPPASVTLTLDGRTAPSLSELTGTVFAVATGSASPPPTPPIPFALVPVLPTTTALSSSRNPSATGQAVTYTATISPVPDGGTVSFTDGGATIAGCGAVPVSAQYGTATCDPTYSAPGTHSIEANYSGDASFGASSPPPVTQSVVSSSGSPTNTTLTSSLDPSVTGEQVIYSALVSPGPGGGSVSFTDDGGTIPGCGSVPLDTTTGTASCGPVYSTAGSHTIGASYSGDQSFGSSTAKTLTQVVNPFLSSSPPSPSSGPSPPTATGGTSSPAPPSGTPGQVCLSAGYAANSAFICQAYEDLLGRMPDQEGLSTFLTLLSSGTGRSQVASDILESTEYRSRLVLSIYRGFLGRAPDPGGLATYLGMLSAGATERQVISEVVGSPEFYSDSGSSDVGFVTHAYVTILGRVPDQGGLSTFLGVLSSGATRTEVASDLLSSFEHEADTVGFYYRYLLGRAPGPSGLATQVGFLSSGGTIQQLVANIIGSQEFYSHASTVTEAAQTCRSAPRSVSTYSVEREKVLGEKRYGSEVSRARGWQCRWRRSNLR